MMNIAVLCADIYCADEICLLTNELGYPVNENMTKQWLEFIIDSSNHGVFVAKNFENVICGWIVVERRVSLETGFKAEISGLVTNTAFRRLGIGKKLVLACEQWAINNDLNKIVVASNIQRQESHMFYKKLDFNMTKTSHKYEKYVQ